MKNLFIKYKTVVQFVLLFLGTYIILSFFYVGYLKLSAHFGVVPDAITTLVAKQSTALIQSFGFDANVIPHDIKPQMKLIVEGTYLANIIEGCNAMSIIVLFVGFIIAFAQDLKKTLLFILAGATLIYALNIFRIALLAIALYKFPDYESLLHGVVFPAMIYGLVFILWMFWVRIVKKQTL